MSAVPRSHLLINVPIPLIQRLLEDCVKAALRIWESVIIPTAHPFPKTSSGEILNTLIERLLKLYHRYHQRSVFSNLWKCLIIECTCTDTNIESVNINGLTLIALAYPSIS